MNAPAEMTNTAQEEFQAAAAYYDYGYSDEDQHDRIAPPSSLLTPTGDRAVLTAAMAGAQSSDSCLISPERMERKQRSLARRNGADHSLLLKSAVLAALDEDEDDDEDDTERNCCFDDDDDESSLSFSGHDGDCDNDDCYYRVFARRKRARRYSTRHTTTTATRGEHDNNEDSASSSNAEDDEAIAVASSLFGSSMSLSASSPFSSEHRRGEDATENGG